MSRLPWKIAVGDSGLQLSSDMEEPPRTRSSEGVQSRGDHGLPNEVSGKLRRRSSQCDLLVSAKYGHGREVRSHARGNLGC